MGDGVSDGAEAAGADNSVDDSAGATGGAWTTTGASGERRSTRDSAVTMGSG
jgi:hypothetical protein